MEKDTYYSVEECFLPVIEAGAWGIYDTQLKQFVRCHRSGKSAWAEKRHASCAFANAISDYSRNWRHKLRPEESRYIKDNPRYKIIRYSSIELN